ncbi:MAG: DUF4234 domain-containing protein [Terracidiphilus sp.]
MKRRSPLAVLFLPFITFGIYGFVWYVKTKNEMNSLGAAIPSGWLLIVPFANIYWLWVYGTGVAQVTKGTYSALGSFLLRIFLGPIGCAILQNEFNKIAFTSQLPVVASAN